jgi:hypothetical protein
MKNGKVLMVFAHVMKEHMRRLMILVVAVVEFRQLH